MDILITVSLVSNSQIKINFDGGDLSYDAGLLLFNEFIIEGKSGFDFTSVISSSKLVNTNRLLVHSLAYNLFN